MSNDVSRNRIGWHYLCNIKPEIVGEWGTAESIVIIGSKKPVLCYTYHHPPPHTHTLIAEHYICLWGGEEIEIGHFIFWNFPLAFYLILDLIFLTHIIICFPFFLEYISQNACNLYSSYIYFGILSVLFLSK